MANEKEKWEIFFYLDQRFFITSLSDSITMEHNFDTFNNLLDDVFDIFQKLKPDLYTDIMKRKTQAIFTT